MLIEINGQVKELCEMQLNRLKASGVPFKLVVRDEGKKDPPPAKGDGQTV